MSRMKKSSWVQIVNRLSTQCDIHIKRLYLKEMIATALILFPPQRQRHMPGYMILLIIFAIL